MIRMWGVRNWSGETRDEADEEDKEDEEDEANEADEENEDEVSFDNHIDSDLEERDNWFLSS